MTMKRAKADQKRKSGLKKPTFFDVINVLLQVLLGFCFLYPIWYCIICSISSADALKTGLPLLWPKGATLQAYAYILKSADIFRYYLNTIFYALGGTLISLVLTAMMAYPFTVEEFKGKKLLNLLMVIPMFIGGGLLPTYYLISGMGLRNTVWVMLLPGAVTGYNMIVFRTFFKSIPASLREAAYVDGAGHYRVLVTIMVPLSAALLATFGLFGIVGRWNDWFTPFLYLTRDSHKPMQLYLRTVLVAISSKTQQEGDVLLTMNQVVEQNIKCATILITILPILCVYPFLQKYFAKGVMVGAVKS